MSTEEKFNQAKGAIKEGVGKLTGDKKTENILRLVVKKSPTGESTHYFFFVLK